MRVSVCKEKEKKRKRERERNFEKSIGCCLFNTFHFLVVTFESITDRILISISDECKIYRNAPILTKKYTSFFPLSCQTSYVCWEHWKETLQQREYLACLFYVFYSKLSKMKCILYPTIQWNASKQARFDVKDSIVRTIELITYNRWLKMNIYRISTIALSVWIFIFMKCVYLTIEQCHKRLCELQFKGIKPQKKAWG